jgi:hypothetical protein
MEDLCFGRRIYKYMIRGCLEINSNAVFSLHALAVAKCGVCSTFNGATCSPRSAATCSGGPLRHLQPQSEDPDLIASGGTASMLNYAAVGIYVFDYINNFLNAPSTRQFATQRPMAGFFSPGSRCIRREYGVYSLS